MKILLLNGSGGQNSTNKRLLQYFDKWFPQFEFVYTNYLIELPLFNVDIKSNGNNVYVERLKTAVKSCDTVYISTPEYLHNIPALLKNVFEWITESGVMDQKKVIAMTYTPHAPRGEKAMVSLLNSLNALNAKVLIEFSLHHKDIFVSEKGEVDDNGGKEMIEQALSLL